MKSKLQILYETVCTFVQCWYDGEPQFLTHATNIQFLPKRVAFMLSELVRATSDRREPKPLRDAPRPPKEDARDTEDKVVVHEIPSPTVASTPVGSPRTHMPSDAENYIQMAHQMIQKLSLIALGHTINSDTTNVTVTSLTETLRTLTLTLCTQEHTPRNTTSCPVS